MSEATLLKHYSWRTSNSWIGGEFVAENASEALRIIADALNEPSEDGGVAWEADFPLTIEILGKSTSV